MTGARRVGLALAAALGLAACSGGGGIDRGMQGAAVDALRGLVPSEGQGAEVPRLRPGQRAVLPDGFGAGATSPLLFAHLDASGAVATLQVAAQGDGVTTWRAADPVTLSTAGGGVLVATRGLRVDLMAAETEVAAALASGRSGPVARRHGYLDGAYRTQVVVFDCVLAETGAETVRIAGVERAARRFEETCRGTDSRGAVEFANVYWRDAQRAVIWQSRQWIGRETGVVNLQRVVE